MILKQNTFPYIGMFTNLITFNIYQRHKTKGVSEPLNE